MMKTSPAVTRAPRKNPPKKIPSVDNNVDPGASENIQIIVVECLAITDNK